MGSEIISEIFDNYGLMGLGLFVLAIIALSVFIKHATHQLTKISWPKFKLRGRVDPSLKEHLFFTNAHFKLRFDIPSLELLENKPTLQQMYRDLMYYNVEAFYYGCKGLIRVPELAGMNGAEWDAEVKHALQCMFKSMEEKAEDLGVPHVALKKYLKWAAGYNDMLRDYVTQISTAAVYGESIIRTTTFLLIMNLLVITMVGDLERLARDITDDMKGAVYRGDELEV